MALKFLNKKGWHTGSLRNIENVWKAEQKHDAEQKKLEELRKQILEERERSEFRQLQEQAGLVPRQERLDFLYESGLAVGKSSDGFKALETPAAAEAALGTTSAGDVSSKAAVPGALFEDKPQSSNDAWRKLHSDPLLLIRQREQEALARIKNNPIQMSMIRKSVEAEKNRNMDDKGKREKREHKREHHHNVKNEKNSDSEYTSESEDDRKKRKHSKRRHSSRDNSKVEERRKNDCLASERHKDGDSQHPNRSSGIFSNSGYPRESEQDMRNNSKKKLEDKEERSDRLASDRLIGRHSKHEKRLSRIRPDSRYPSESEEDGRNHKKRKHSSKDNSEDEEERRDGYHRKDIHSKHENHSSRIGPNSTYKERRKHVPSEKSKEVPTQNEQGPGCNHRKSVPKMTEEEREARLREMQMDAELHEEQRWKRITNAAEADAREAARATNSGGKNFLDAAQKSLYGTEKGGRSTIEESVRRRAYYSQGGSAAHESNAFRR